MHQLLGLLPIHWIGILLSRCDHHNSLLTSILLWTCANVFYNRFFREKNPESKFVNVEFQKCILFKKLSRRLSSRSLAAWRNNKTLVKPGYSSFFHFCQTVKEQRLEWICFLKQKLLLMSKYLKQPTHSSFGCIGRLKAPCGRHSHTGFAHAVNHWVFSGPS